MPLRPVFILLVTGVLSGKAVAQCPDGSPPPCSRTAARAAAPNSIAVLYFSNESRDTADQYLADGITEEITTSLGRIARLRVASPAAVRRITIAAGGDPARVARALGVRNVVEGSIRRAGGQARITARLLGADAVTALWTDAYTRPTTDLLALEEEIARQVATGVIGTLLPEERRAIGSTTVNPVAHDHVLRGNFQLGRRTDSAIRRAIAEYQAAIATDSTYAMAWARLALGNALLREYGRGNLPAAEQDSILAAGERAAARSMALDSTFADAWIALGMVRGLRDPLHMTGMLAAARRAVALDPRSADAWHLYGAAASILADTAGARQGYMRALELEPGRMISVAGLGNLELMIGHPREALVWLDSAIAIDPSQPLVHASRARAHAALSDTTDVLLDLAASEREDADPYQTNRCEYARAAAASDLVARCRHVLAVSPLPWDSAWAWLALGDKNRVLDALERAVAQRQLGMYASLVLEPAWRIVRGDPRFVRVLDAVRPAEAAR